LPAVLLLSIANGLLRVPAETAGALLELPLAIGRLNRTLDAMLTEVTEMRRGVQELVGEVGGLREDFAGIRRELGEVYDEVAPMRRRVDGLHEEVVGLGGKFDGLAGDLGRLPFMRRRGAPPPSPPSS
jgi:hypothetical protein